MNLFQALIIIIDTDRDMGLWYLDIVIKEVYMRWGIDIIKSKREH